MDRIWARPYVGVRDAGDWNGAEGVIEGSAYLLSTPEREMASELEKALREIVTCGQMTFAGDAADPLSVEMVTIARAALTELEGKG